MRPARRHLSSKSRPVSFCSRLTNNSMFKQTATLNANRTSVLSVQAKHDRGSKRSYFCTSSQHDLLRHQKLYYVCTMVLWHNIFRKSLSRATRGSTRSKLLSRTDQRWRKSKALHLIYHATEAALTQYHSFTVSSTK
jgi:hypothetical protein